MRVARNKFYIFQSLFILCDDVCSSKKSNFRANIFPKHKCPICGVIINLFMAHIQNSSHFHLPLSVDFLGGGGSGCGFGRSVVESFTVLSFTSFAAIYKFVATFTRFQHSHFLANLARLKTMKCDGDEFALSRRNAKGGGG